MIQPRNFAIRKVLVGAGVALSTVAPVGAQTASAPNATASATPGATAAPTFTIPIDNFENGVGNWASNDRNRAGLSGIVAVPAGAPLAGAPRSKGAGQVTFKSASQGWASVSRPVNGAAWNQIGARELVFALEGSGDTNGVDLQLRAKGAGGDIVFSLPQPVRLDAKKWRQVVIPLSDFKGPKGEALLPRLSEVYLLQFAQSGAWSLKFFTLDDLLVRGYGAPAKPAVPVVAPAPPAPDALPAGAVAVNVDFKRVQGTIRAGANVDLMAPYDTANTQSLELSPNYRGALATLSPRFVRLDVSALADLTDSSRPAFDFSRLVSAARRVRSLGAEPLVAIANADQWGLDARGYGTLAGGAARALNPRGTSLARYFELASWSSDVSASDAVAFYNAGYGAVKGVSKNLVVGGYGAPAGDTGAQNALLQGARGLDFFSGSFYGARAGAPSDAELLGDARTISDLKTAAGLLDKSRFRRAPLWVTSANLSSARAAGDFVPSDKRLVGTLSGAWWAQFLGSGSRLADQIFHNDATNPEWGLLLVENRAQAFPAYYSMYLWNTYFAGGTERVVAESANDAVFATATNTKTAHNLLLVNTTALPQVAQVGIRGFPTLRQVRIHRTDDPALGVRTTALPNSPFQTLRLPPYSVSVVQFIEPPK